MATKKPCNEATTATVQRGLPPAYYHLHALLETIRALECHEDELCALIHHIQRSGKLTAALRRDITNLLNNLPAGSLQVEIQAAYSAVDEAAA